MNKERLLKLAEHLEVGELGHEVFDFTVYGGCGFAGCALGECPTVFPDDWAFRGLTPMLRDGARVFWHL